MLLKPSFMMAKTPGDNCLKMLGAGQAPNLKQVSYKYVGWESPMKIELSML